MEITTIPYGPLSSNMYILEDEGYFYVIDPSIDPDDMDKETFDFSKVKGLLITHGHFDHIFYLDKWKSATNADVYMSPEDFNCLEDASYNLSCDFGINLTFAATAKSIYSLEDDGKITFEIVATPGHSPGSVCIIAMSDNKRAMFSGDMLFAGSIGRTDFPTGSYKDMTASIKLLKSLDDCVVYPGHGPDTTLNEEIKSNPYFN